MPTLNSSYDVLVVGSGNAALAAALSARQTGATVAVFEAAPRSHFGGNSRYSSGIFRIWHDGLSSVLPLLDKSALEEARRCRMGMYTRDDYAADMARTSGGQCDKEQLAVLLDRCFDTVAWMKSLGVPWRLPLGKFLDHDKVLDASGESCMDLPPWDTVMAIGGGAGLMNSLRSAAEAVDIAIHYSAPVCDLLTQGDTVTGIIVRGRDETRHFAGQVILACGGFEASPRLRRQFLGEGWDLTCLRGSKFNTGSMMERAVAAGAGVAGHFGGCHATPHDLGAPRTLDPDAGDTMSRYSFPYSITVNLDGRRFMDEGEDHFSLTYAKAGATIARQPRAAAWQVFDQKTTHLLEPRYASALSVVRDDTLAGLAVKMGVDAGIFAETVRAFNAATPAAAAENFNPLVLDGVSTGAALTVPKSNWALPVDKGPFVAYGVTCGITFTYGGLATDSSARVLNQEGLPMPGLWAVGEIAGGFFAFNYAGGTGLTRGAVFGRIAGQAAAERAKRLGKENSFPGFVSSAMRRFGYGH
ncbi:hypothetical protein V2A60_002563 [Cordyceps javanica]|uniref:Tricarballylate dehydrogenase n=1 Tax=Cordyceps javanica TaxID=43265 RepID=A0A545VX41_9HYPO|nr:tricarballylate dehydrogenase [Cordyceps javanica]TQW06274.1 tricarballylate dehydrogenase [Cordyceps javanica]